MMKEVKTWPEVNRRRYKRKPVHVEVRYSSPEGLISDWVMNISRGGMFISTSSPLPVGTNLSIQFSTPGKEIPVKLEGVVIWVSTPEKREDLIPGMGIEITSISDEDRKYFEEFIESVKSPV
jgi:uncharacterized protein (TIGR02266 family)